jgi:hypothetical protein
MNGAENIKDVARTVRPLSTQRNSLSWPDAAPSERQTVDPGGGGALAAADRALNLILDNSGFVDIAAPFSQNFAACLDQRSTPADVGSSSPGALGQLMAIVKRQIATEADQSEQAQAGVRPEAAVKLLM